MAYLGLVPTEHSSGERQRRGAITKAGNSRCRHILVQAAWAARRPPGRSAILEHRQRGQPASLVPQTRRAQQRLHALYSRVARRRPAQIAAVAVARELAGFLWAAMQEAREATMPARAMSA